MNFHVSLIFFLMAGLGLLEVEASPGGCSSFLMPFPTLCEFGTAWGVAVLTAIGAAILISVLMVLLLCHLLPIGHAKRPGGIALLLMFSFIVALCSLSFLHLTEGNQLAFIPQHILLVLLFFSSLGYLLTQGMKLGQIPKRCCGSGIKALRVLTVSVAAGQGTAAIRWVAETVANQGRLPCQSQLLCLVMPLIFVVVLLTGALSGVAWSRSWKRQHWKRRAVMLFITWLTSALLWAARVTFYMYANAALGLPSNWDNFEHAVVLLVQAWLLLLLHAIPEAYAWLHLPPDPMLQEWMDALWAPEEMSLSSISGATSLSPCKSWYSSAQSGSFGPKPMAPFRSNTPRSIRITLPD